MTRYAERDEIWTWAGSLLDPNEHMSGAMVRRLLLLTALLANGARAQRPANEWDPCPPLLDICFVIDTSGSVQRVYDDHIRWTRTLIDSLPIREDAVRVCAIQYASYPLTEFSLATYKSAESVHEHLKKINFQSGVTRTGYALRKAESELFREEKGARGNADKLIVLFSDGLSIDDTHRIADSLAAKNVSIFVASVDNEGFSAEMERIAGSHNNTFGPKDLDRLNSSVQWRVELSRFCNNGLRLADIPTTSTTTRSTTTTTTSPTSIPSDIIVWLPHVRRAPSQVIEERLKSNSKGIGAVIAQVKPFSNKRTAQQTVAVAPISVHKDKEFKTIEKTTVLATRRFFRRSSQNPATAEEASTSVATTTRSVLRGLTHRVDTRKTKKIVSLTPPPTTTKKRPTSSIAHTTAKKTVTPHKPSKEQTSKVTTTAHPIELATTQSARRSRSFLGAGRQPPGDNKQKSCPTDVLLLVDSSGSVQKIYEAQKEFLASILEEIDLSTHDQRVALIQFSGSGHQKIEWTFDQMKANEELMKAFSKVRHFTGTTFIGAALKSARQVLEGRRPGVRTVVVLISDGYSQDDVLEGAEEIRKLDGIDVFAVSITPVTNTDLLSKITGNPDNVFVSHEANLMKDVLISHLQCANNRR